MEYLMAFDAFIALFRGLFLESFPNIAGKTDAFLDGPFNEYSNETIRRALKFIADKFVCHLDPISL